jgi:hypothetical protein
MIYRELGHTPKMSGVGRIMMSLAGMFIPDARETVEMMYEFERAFIIDSARAEAAFGQRATPLEEGIRRSVAWHRARHSAQPVAA